MVFSCTEFIAVKVPSIYDQILPFLQSPPSRENVIIQNRTFVETDKDNPNLKEPCRCIGSKSITIGKNVIVEPDAIVSFEAPEVDLESGFKAKAGSKITLKQN